ncbi:MAG: ABC transporter ATP-binding protein/permease [Clostridia bacterium]|nr:ABC transporter ATP-binding protein/permease [Clostridia bacterium]
MASAKDIKANARPPKMGGRRGIVMGDKPKDFKGSMKRLLKFISPFKWKIILVMVLIVAATVLSVINPKVLAMATDTLADGVKAVAAGTGEIDFDRILQIVFYCILLYGASSIFNYLQGFIIAGVSTKIAYNLRTSIMQKIDRLPVSYFNRVSYGDVLSRITNDVDTINMNLNQTLSQAISAVITLLGVLVMMLTISWRLTLVVLITLPMSAGVMAFVMKKSQKHFFRHQNILGSVNGQVEEMYGGHVAVKAFNGEEDAVASFNEDNEKLYEAAWKSNFISGLMHPFMILIGNLGYVAVVVFGAGMTMKGTMTIGGIQAFIIYTRNFTQPISQVAQIANQFQMLVAAYERVDEFLGEDEIDDPEPKVCTADIDIKGDIKFDHVKFGYEDTDKIVIKDFSCDVKAGQKVAIVGPTGAGKTTLVKLLMRFHDLKDGAIYVDGHDITEFDRGDLRREFGMVLQDTWLYQASIRDNIRYGELTATDEQVVEAAKAAQVDHFIRTLPGGYDMEINEEANNISAGQKQLLTIARAILSNAKVLILDEATSSVDTRTEVMIQEAMDNLMQGRTSFIIAHRLSTIRNADLILCLNDGDIVEQGTHDELMALNGFYANLYNSQFENNG